MGKNPNVPSDQKTWWTGRFHFYHDLSDTQLVWELVTDLRGPLGLGPSAAGTPSHAYMAIHVLFSEVPCTAVRQCLSLGCVRGSTDTGVSCTALNDLWLPDLMGNFEDWQNSGALSLGQLPLSGKKKTKHPYLPYF